MFVFVIAVVMSAISISMAQQSKATLKTFSIYKMSPSCVCIATHRHTVSADAKDLNVNGDIYQVFTSHDRQRRELFRVRVGDSRSKWWNYGIVDEADFNADGRSDYTWYGGDDTSSQMYVFLSTDSGYRRVDVLKTIAAAWTMQFHNAAPDFGSADSEYSLQIMRLGRTPDGMTLDAKIMHTDKHGGSKTAAVLRIAEANFQFVIG